MLQTCPEETYQKGVLVKLLQEAGGGEGSRPSEEIYAKIKNNYFKSFLVRFQNKLIVNNLIQHSNQQQSLKPENTEVILRLILRFYTKKKGRYL